MSTSRPPSVALAVALGAFGALCCACGTGDIAAPGLPSPSTADGSGRSPLAGPHEVFVVAHQDDDLLFMNPDVGRAILEPSPVTTVYLTAGDAGRADDSYYLERERGVLAAYADLATVADPHWTEERIALNGHDLLVRRMREVDVSIVFMRLPDGNGTGAGYATSRGSPGGSLAKLWQGRVQSLRAVDGSATYDREDLVDTLAALFDRFQATRIDALDGTDAFGFDHSDHVHAGLFTQQAAPPSATLRIYRGYNIRSEAENLSSDEVHAKWSAFRAYVQHDTAICQAGKCDAKILDGYAAYATRQYVVGAEQGFVGPLANASGLCLDVFGDRVVSTTCADTASQRFTVTTEGHLLAPDRRCLTGNASAPVLAACTTGVDPDPQRWSLLSGGNLINLDGGQCLLGSASGELVSLGRCDRNPRSQWAVRFAPERSRTHRNGFVSAHLLFADIDGDGHADLCGRGPEGLACARADGIGSFEASSVVSADFDDAHGWSDAARSRSLHAIDIDRDGNIDFCGLAADGIQCARGLGRGAFGTTTKVSRATDFESALDGSFTMGDIDGDGFPDACARIGADVSCALGDRAGALLPATVWLRRLGPGEMPEVPNSRWVLADVSGDGVADMCRVGADGIVCATTHRHLGRFERMRRWLVPVDSTFQYDTVVFGDVDGDHASDVCTLSGRNVVCASSTGSSFSALLVRVAGFPEDASWSSARLALGDIDGDRRADSCRWTDAGITCATAP